VIRASICAALGLLLSWSAAAAPVTVANPGFEELYLGSNLPPVYGGDVPTGAFPTGPPPASWTAYYESGSPMGGEFLGVLNPGTSADYMGTGAMPCFPGGAPEGDNVALLFTSGAAGGDEYGITQVLAATLEADTTYTLTVEVGNIQSCEGLVSPYTSFFDLDGFPSYRVQLLAGGVVLAEDSGAFHPGEGLFETAIVQLTTGSSVAPGQALEIRLINRNEPDVPGVDGLEVDFDHVRLDASTSAAVPIPALAGWLAGALIAGAGLSRLSRAKTRAQNPRCRPTPSVSMRRL
jgi:hypothetical protein